MKNNVFDFIESKTLRQHLSGQVLAPAIECIIIAQSCCRSLEDKLEALEERYETYSVEEFKNGVYHSCANDFKTALARYISFKYQELILINITDEESVFIIRSDRPAVDLSTWRTLEDAIKFVHKKLDDDELFTINHRKVSNDYELGSSLLFNKNRELYDIETHYFEEYFEEEYGIRNAYAEIPHLYKIGDIVKSGDEYAVVADVKHNMVLPEYMKHSDYTDMCLYCLGYYKDQLHSCNGAFGHSHFPILQTELCPEEELPESKKELIILSRLLKGEIRLADFLEMYSNGDIDSLMKIKGLIK